MKPDKYSVFVLVFFSLLFLIVMLLPGKDEVPIKQAKAEATPYVSDSALMAEVNAMPNTPPKKLLHFTEADVARFTMATVMGREANTISVRKKDGVYIVSYIRPNDSQQFTYKVKIEGNRAIWANIDGRWRNTPDDEYITFNEVGKKLQITEVYSDKSVNVKQFSK